MKKLYFLSFLLTGMFVSAQSVVITTVVDGTIGATCGTNGSNPKFVELYVSGTVDFTNYKFQTESNGVAAGQEISWSTGTVLAPLGTVTNSFVYLVGAGADVFSTVYPTITLPSGLSGLPNGNGNDAYRIVNDLGEGNVVVIDQFGNPADLVGNVYTAAWVYQDSYAKRNSGVAANGGVFVNSSFTYGGDGHFVAPNNTCEYLATTVELGQFTLSVKENTIEGLKVYPNPVTRGSFQISTDANGTKDVLIFDVLGKQVVKTTTENTVNVSNLTAGVYIVKVTENGKTATKKLVVK